MKKIFTSFLASGTVALLVAACGKPKAKLVAKETKIKQKEPSPAIVKDTKVKDIFKIGYIGSDIEYTKYLKETLQLYTQDVADKSIVGDKFYDLPQQLFLLSSDEFSFDPNPKYDEQVELLRAYLIEHTAIGRHNTEDGYYEDSKYRTIRPNWNSYNKMKRKIDELNEVFLWFAHDTKFKTTINQLLAKYSTELVSKIYDALQTTTPTVDQLKTAIQVADPNLLINIDLDDITSDNLTHLNKNQLYWNTNLGVTANPLTKLKLAYFDKDTTKLKSSLLLKAENKNIVKNKLHDKTKLAAKNIDALFVHVTDDVENSPDIYKAVVENKNFKETKLFFVGDKAKSQHGDSSKNFAGGNISTASFNKYAAVYIGGFQAAVGAIKFSSSEDVYEETDVAFLIGALEESKDKKKAYAFRRGVEAATLHPEYLKYLKVKFVSKAEDTASSEKLYRSKSDWQAKENGKTKLYEFSSSETFTDSERKIVYIAGSTARDWTGLSKHSTVAELANLSNLSTTLKFNQGDDTGLIGALYNYKEAEDSGTLASALAQKTFSKAIWVVLDKAQKVTYIEAVNANRASTEADVDKLMQKGVDAIKTGITPFERHEIKFYGAIGQKAAGTKSYVETALKGLYMGGSSYMIGKHTIFGAPLDLSQLTITAWDSIDADDANKNIPWLYKRSDSSKDSAKKIEKRFELSFEKAIEQELIEEELIKEGIWLK